MKLPIKRRKTSAFNLVLFVLGGTICIVASLFAVITLKQNGIPEGVEISNISVLEKPPETIEPSYNQPRVLDLEERIEQQQGRNGEKTIHTAQNDFNSPSENNESEPGTVTREHKSVRLKMVTNQALTEAAEHSRAKSNVNDNISGIPNFDNNSEVDVLPWQVNAVTVKKIAGVPQVAIVIDDAGLDRKLTEHAIRLAGPLTFSFLPYAAGLKLQVQKAKRLGHEIMAHVPMEPDNPLVDPGPQFLATGQTIKEIKKRLEWSLSQVPGIVGFNNHMGSRFTSDIRGMKIVIEEVRLRGLLFLDSRTSQHTVGAKLAKKYKVPFAIRNVFLDHEPGLSFIQSQLMKLETHAKRHGFAVAICHPRATTIEALYQWLPIVAEKGLVLVPVSAIVANSNRV